MLAATVQFCDLLAIVFLEVIEANRTSFVTVSCLVELSHSSLQKTSNYRYTVQMVLVLVSQAAVSSCLDVPEEAR